MQAYLRVVAGPDQGRSIELAEGAKLTIGRAEKSDTRLTDLGISRLHCELLWQAGRFHLVDLETVGGTLIDGERITERDLKHGQEFQIGGTRLKLHAPGIPIAEPPKTAAHPAAPQPALKLEPDDDEDALTGQTISHFELGPLVGRGRTGAVYKARDVRDGKDVAFKVLRSEFTNNLEDVQRFIQAMTTAVDLRHPNLIALYAAGKRGITCWCATEYVDGDPLTKIIERSGTPKPINWRIALTVGVQIARALEAAHAKQLIHRNIAPANILIRKKDKVAKLGKLRLTMALEKLKARQTANPNSLVGDIVFMSPERAGSDAAPDARSDIYGLGATLYAMLTGKPPCQGKTLMETIDQICQVDPIDPKEFQPSIPDRFQDAVMMMLAKKPGLRFQTAARAAQSLENVAKIVKVTV